jgi:hypothetical protein
MDEAGEEGLGADAEAPSEQQAPMRGAGGPRIARAREWAYVRVIKKATGQEQPPNTIGNAADKCKCVFCGIVMSAQVYRIREHVGGVKASMHIKACRGPQRKDDDSEALFDTRTAQFRAARADCVARAAEIRAAAHDRQQDELLDARTSGHGLPPGSKRPKHMSVQSTLKTVVRTNNQQEADIYLSRALYASGIAPTVLESPYFKRALQKVALCGSGYEAPGRRAVMNNLLDNERTRLSAEMETARAAISSKFGMTLAADGMAT